MKLRVAGLYMLLSLAACGPADTQQAEQVGTPPDIIATNAFYYYEDVDVAWQFYRDVLGLETVVDYGFAKILRLAEDSYLTLVRASEGMHSADEPKTVLLRLVTDTLNPWAEHLAAQDVPMRVTLDQAADSNHFVAVDPGGYQLKFERYNPHAAHEGHVAAFAESNPVASAVQGSPSIRATSFAVYFDNVASVQDFYDSLFATSPISDENGRLLYRIAGSGFISLVDGADDLLSPTEKNGVTLSFLTTDVDAWYERASNWPGYEARTPGVLDEGEVVRVFVGYDPAGIFLEWDTFLDREENSILLRYLSAGD